MRNNIVAGIFQCLHNFAFICLSWRLELDVVRALRPKSTSLPVSGAFFVFPYPPFQFLKLVVISGWFVAAFVPLKEAVWLVDQQADHRPHRRCFYSAVFLLYLRIGAHTASCGCRLFTERALGAKVFCMSWRLRLWITGGRAGKATGKASALCWWSWPEDLTRRTARAGTGAAWPERRRCVCCRGSGTACFWSGTPSPAPATTCCRCRRTPESRII